MRPRVQRAHGRGTGAEGTWGVLGGDRGYRPTAAPCAAAAAQRRAEAADRAAHQLSLEIAALQAEGISTRQGLARALTKRGVSAPGGGAIWTHTTASRLIARAAA